MYEHTSVPTLAYRVSLIRDSVYYIQDFKVNAVSLVTDQSCLIENTDTLFEFGINEFSVDNKILFYQLFFIGTSTGHPELDAPYRFF